MLTRILELTSKSETRHNFEGTTKTKESGHLRTRLHQLVVHNSTFGTYCYRCHTPTAGISLLQGQLSAEFLQFPCLLRDHLTLFPDLLLLLLQ